jgi:nitrate reductase alpha subunit
MAIKVTKRDVIAYSAGAVSYPIIRKTLVSVYGFFATLRHVKVDAHADVEVTKTTPRKKTGTR